MTVRLLTRADVPSAMRLKEAAGWNQTERDWVKLLEVAPESCFGIDKPGSRTSELAATASAICYGAGLAWIGMVLTDPAYRGRGLARQLMEHTLAWLDERGIPLVKLDATDMGRPLYEKLGFVGECAVERWGRDAAAGRLAVQPELRPGYDRALDLEAFGADRSAVVLRMAVECAGVDGGFAMGRPGSRAPYFGPCVARTPRAARCLLEWFLARHPAETVYWDLLPDNKEAVRLAEEHGFRRLRSLVRMTRPAGAPFVHNDSSVYAIAGFEYG